MELSETNQIACSHLSGYVSVIDLATGDLNRSIVPLTNGEMLVFDGQGKLIAGDEDMLQFMTWVVEQPVIAVVETVLLLGLNAGVFFAHKGNVCDVPVIAVLEHGVRLHSAAR